MSRKPLSEGSEWTFELLQSYDTEIARIAAGFGLDTYPNQIEIITSEQMMDCYSSTGMPVFYPHWSFGKQFLTVEKSYRRGYMGLAYELVINSNPCIAYLMEENSMTMQALVIAHACYGHNSFFKNNYLFKTWTNADAIIDYLVFARNYIAECEERYGVSAVEELLDSCHALMNYGVDRYRRPPALSITEEKHRQKEREEYLQSQINDLWLRTVPKKERYFQEQAHQFPAEPEENLLYFFEKNAPLLESWQREIIRIVRKIAQYLYPQRQTKVMNEGWATFWHYTLLNRLYDEGLVTDGFMLEFLQSHTNVISQPPYYSNHFSGLNPYALGFAMMSDIRRICEHPADEDRKWFPDLVDTDWTKTLDFAMRNFKDESFIAQYLSPKVIRDFKLFSVLDDDLNDELEITHIHDEDGYRAVRHVLSDQYNLGNLEPSIQVYRVDTRGDRSLTLRHYQHHRRPLGESTNEMLRHVRRLWGFKARLETVDENGRIQKSYECD
ncbi:MULTISPECIES: SpoVR family protein [Methylocaldum]|jgi:stage V sporulation protein R|uniref:SpoVR family protein n=1 Tax=unclassified Methylocaldum TaxID=2622260 RepID=UPI00098B2498|nr:MULTISPECIES: SpoVR family protein [unclassified Methylocaldum]MBP1152156.1 spore cortex formation protein SpoVR/YcgB (stage V sporulation) [Methylocaldum sp. RMAD-M]MDV3242076.1 SpoVR family protein [Methylocaldum sp.]MVF24799.1 SpoVR family protein [Methylocaldum sp. BRCS4]